MILVKLISVTFTLVLKYSHFSTDECLFLPIVKKMYNKTIIEFGFRMISWIIKTSCLCYLLHPSASADNTDLGFDNSWYHAQPHPIIVYYQRDHNVMPPTAETLTSKGDKTCQILQNTRRLLKYCCRLHGT